MRVTNLFTVCVSALALAGAPAALAATSTGAPVSGGSSTTSGSPGGQDSGGQGSGAQGSGGAGVGTAQAGPSTPERPTVHGVVAKIIHGIAYAPDQAPIQVQRAIWAGNRIRTKPYVYGGGHQSFKSDGYDCSGSVSYVLHAAGLLRQPDDSSDFMGWGRSGLGDWITVYTNSGHAFVQIAGIRLDTSAEGDRHPTSGSGPRWRSLLGDTSSYMQRHVLGL